MSAVGEEGELHVLTRNEGEFVEKMSELAQTGTLL